MEQIETAADQANVDHRKLYARVHRFARYQQNRRRNWVNFSEIAAWCAHEGGSVAADGAKRMEAYKRLWEGILWGEFERNGRSMILLLGKTPSSNGRWTCDDVVDAVRAGGCTIDACAALFQDFWAPAALAEGWFARRQLSMPAHLRPTVPAGAAGGSPVELTPSEAASPERTVVASPDAVPVGAGAQIDSRPRPTDPAVRQWFRDRVAQWPDNKPAPSEGEDQQAIAVYFAPGLTRDEIRLVREDETPEAWRKQGPRPPWGIAKKKLSLP